MRIINLRWIFVPILHLAVGHDDGDGCASSNSHETERTTIRVDWVHEFLKCTQEKSNCLQEKSNCQQEIITCQREITTSQNEKSTCQSEKSTCEKENSTCHQEKVVLREALVEICGFLDCRKVAELFDFIGRRGLQIFKDYNQTTTTRESSPANTSETTVEGILDSSSTSTVIATSIATYPVKIINGTRRNINGGWSGKSTTNKSLKRTRSCEYMINHLKRDKLVQMLFQSLEMFNIEPSDFCYNLPTYYRDLSNVVHQNQFHICKSFTPYEKFLAVKKSNVLGATKTIYLALLNVDILLKKTNDEAVDRAIKIYEANKEKMFSKYGS